MSLSVQNELLLAVISFTAKEWYFSAKLGLFCQDLNKELAFKPI